MMPLLFIILILRYLRLLLIAIADFQLLITLIAAADMLATLMGCHWLIARYCFHIIDDYAMYYRYLRHYATRHIFHIV